MIDELYRIPMRMNLIKAPGERLWALLALRETATFPPQADHVLEVFFFIRGGPGGCIKAPQHLLTKNSGLW